MFISYKLIEFLYIVYEEKHKYKKALRKERNKEKIAQSKEVK